MKIEITFAMECDEENVNPYTVMHGIVGSGLEKISSYNPSVKLTEYSYKFDYSKEQKNVEEDITVRPKKQDCYKSIRRDEDGNILEYKDFYADSVDDAIQQCDAYMDEQGWIPVEGEA